MKLNKLLSLAMAGALSLSLAACGGTPAESKAPVESVAPVESAAADSDVAYIQDKGTLVVGMTEFAPMDYTDDKGEWIGFDADMCKKVAEKLGVECQFVKIEWDNKLMEINNKSIDVLWNGMTLTDDVVAALECTKPYCKNAQVVVVPADKAEEYQTKDSLKDLTFAVESGSAGMEAAQAEGFTFNELEAQSNALMEVAAGTSDAAILDLLMAGAMIGEGTSYPNLTHTVELTSEEYGVGCRKGSDLAAYIDGVFDEMDKDGSLKELATTYGVQDALLTR